MEKTDKFNVSRVAQYIRFDFMSNIKSYSMRLIIMAVVLTLVMLLTSLVISGSYNPLGNTETYTSGIGAFATYMLYIATAISLSLIAEPMKTVGGRINHLMLPVSLLEKYVGRLIIATFGVIIAFIGSLLLAECVRNIVLFSFGTRYSDVLGFEFFRIAGTMWDNLTLDWVVCAMYLFNILIYLLGGVIWYNYSFVKTLGMKAIIGLIMTIAVGFASVSIAGMIASGDWPEWLDSENFINIFGCLLWIANVSIIIGSYFIYKKAQIAPKRFIFKR